MTWLSAVIERAWNRVTVALTLDSARVTKKGHPFDETVVVLPRCTEVSFVLPQQVEVRKN